MNKIFRTSLVLLTALPFAACQNDVQAPDNSQSSGKPVRLEVGLTYGDAATRTTLEDVDGNLKCTWDKGDRVIVSSIVETGTTGNAVRFGEITLLDDYAGQVKGYFAGDLLNIDNFDGKQVLFTYAGKGVETKDFDIDSHKLSIATQDGTLASLTKYDILRGYTEVSVAGGIAYTPDMALTRYVAFAHFTLSLPQGVTRTTEPVTISGEGVKNHITYNKRPGTATGQEGAITVNGSGNDLYVVLIPSTVAPEFAVTIGGKTYTGSLPSVKVEKGKYYRDNTTHAGIPVEMEAETDPDWVDFNLPSGLLWYKYNLGASSPEQAGTYYGWGDIQGSNTSGAASSYGPANRPSDAKSSTESSYGTTYYYIESYWAKYKAKYDIAHAVMGEGHRMPDADDINELKANTNYSKTTYNGVNGWKFVAKDDADKWIFIPNAGYKLNGNVNKNGYMYVWLSSLCWYQARLVGGSNNDYSYVKRGQAFTDYFNSGSGVTYGVLNPAYGFPVRPVK